MTNNSNDGQYLTGETGSVGPQDDPRLFDVPKHLRKSTMQNTLRWHVLNVHESHKSLMDASGGMRAGIGHFRTDIYPETPNNKPGFYCFYCHDEIGGDGYSRAVHFDNVFDAMRWAQERYDEYLDPPHVEEDEDRYR